jgi:hypothetical protein
MSVVAGVVVWVRVVFVGSTQTEVATWAVAGSDFPDLEMVETLARWQLSARRLGGSIRLCDMCDELAALLDLVGLRREVGGQAEGGEQVRVEEGVEPRDPIA